MISTALSRLSVFSGFFISLLLPPSAGFADNGGDREAVVRKLASALREKYAFPETGERAAQFIENRLRMGTYVAPRNDSEFSLALTDDLRKASNDQHLVVEWNPSASSPGDAEEKHRQEIERDRRDNFGFEQVSRLPGNVGYLEFHSFADPAPAGNTVIAAMGFLANTDALIIDIRDNGGGTAAMVPFFASYLFKARTHLNDIHWREGHRVEQFWTVENVPGKRMDAIPVYVLTSRRTFSAAEELAYDLQALKRATIVGERTRGGANPGNWVALGGALRVFLPLGQAVNPLTHANWDGSGVAPDIAATREEAYDVAYAQALNRLSTSASGPQQKAQIEWAKTSVMARMRPSMLSPDQAERYVGQYGPRRVTREGTKLSIRYQELPPTVLIPMVDETFGLEGEDGFRVKFRIGSGGHASTLIGLTEDGIAYESELSSR